MKIKMNAICRKDKINKNSTAPIHIRFTHARKIRYVATGVTVYVNDWDFENQCISRLYPDWRQIQVQIDAHLADYEKKIKRLEALDIEVTFDTLFESKNRRTNCTVADCFEREIARLESLTIASHE